MADPLFSPGEATDLTYINLQGGTCVAARDFAEHLWTTYHKFADPHFLTEIRHNFHARLWEMYLTCSLLESAATRGYRVSCPKPGPDILLEIESQRIWVEAIIATAGAAGQPDSVIEPNPDGSGKIPEEKLILRYSTAIRDKYLKYQKYLDGGVVKEADAFVVAINGAALPYKWAWAEKDAPRFLKALYPIGQYRVLLDRRTGKIVAEDNEPRFRILKANQAEVPTQTFLDERSSAISAVLCSYADVGSYSRPLGVDFELAHNPKGRCPIPHRVIPAHRSWVADLTGEEGQLFSRTG